MELKFDPQDKYVQMIMEASDEKIDAFFAKMGIDTNFAEEDDDEGLIDEL